MAVESERSGLEIEPVFDDGPDDGRRVFGTKRQRPAAFVGEGVHFLDDDVGRFPRSFFEELGGLENRGPEFAVSVAFENPPGRGFGELPGFDFSRKDVLGPLDGGEDLFALGFVAHFSTKTP